MGPRRKGRVLAIQALYAYEIQSGATPIEDLVKFPWEEEEGTKEGDTEIGQKGESDALARQFATLLVTGTIQNLPQIDHLIQDHLENWELKRVAKVDLSILRMSVYCLLYQKDIPATVVIDEAVDLSKEFGTEESYRFVNGVLDGIRKSLETKELSSQ
ncbi:MAG: transcription antitermination factor NusB [Spirochaetes bacterium]|nr:transcription antitermination factor NusB [Spirochaetota bacterium]